MLKAILFLAMAMFFMSCASLKPMTMEKHLEITQPNPLQDAIGCCGGSGSGE